MSTGRPHHCGHLLQVWTESLQPLTLYTPFHDLINVYSRRSGADSTRGQNFDVNSHFSHLLQVSKNLFEVWFYTKCFHDFIHVYSHGAGTDNPWGRNFDVNRNILSLRSFVASLKKSLWSLILYSFIHDFIHVYSPGAGADSPTGDKVLMSTEMSCHFIHLLQG